MRIRCFLYTLIGVVLVGSGLAAVLANPRVAKTTATGADAWQTSWPAFVKALAGEYGVPDRPDIWDAADDDYNLDEATRKRLAAFRGQSVAWEGIVTAPLRLQRLWPASTLMCVIRMEPRTIRLVGHDEKVPIMLGVVPRVAELEKWRNLRTGKVRFRAALTGLGHGDDFYKTVGDKPTDLFVRIIVTEAELVQ